MRTLTTKTPHTIYAENLEDEALNQFERCLNMPGCVQGAQSLKQSLKLANGF